MHTSHTTSRIAALFILFTIASALPACSGSGDSSPAPSCAADEELAAYGGGEPACYKRCDTDASTCATDMACKTVGGVPLCLPEQESTCTDDDCEMKGPCEAGYDEVTLRGERVCLLRCTQTTQCAEQEQCELVGQAKFCVPQKCKADEIEVLIAGEGVCKKQCQTHNDCDTEGDLWCAPYSDTGYCKSLAEDETYQKCKQFAQLIIHDCPTAHCGEDPGLGLDPTLIIPACMEGKNSDNGNALEQYADDYLAVFARGGCAHPAFKTLTCGVLANEQRGDTCGCDGTPEPEAECQTDADCTRGIFTGTCDTSVSGGRCVYACDAVTLESYPFMGVAISPIAYSEYRKSGCGARNNLCMVVKSANEPTRTSCLKYCETDADCASGRSDAQSPRYLCNRYTYEGQLLGRGGTHNIGECMTFQCDAHGEMCTINHNAFGTFVPDETRCGPTLHCEELCATNTTGACAEGHTCVALPGDETQGTCHKDT